MKRFSELAKVVGDRAQEAEKRAEAERQRRQICHDKYDAMVRNALTQLVVALRRPELASKIETGLFNKFNIQGPYWHIFTPEPRFEVQIYIPLIQPDDPKCFKCSGWTYTPELTAEALEDMLVSIYMPKSK